MSKEHQLPNGQKIITQLNSLKVKKKFNEELTLFYPGAPDEITRVKAESAINNAIEQLISLSNEKITEQQFWSVLESTARQLSDMDSEEIDRGFKYFEEIMDIYNIESSDGRLNEWRYGLDSI